MIDVVFMAAYKVALAVIAMIATIGLLRHVLDKNHDFRDLAAEFSTGEGIYYGLRFAGVCLLVGQVIG